LRERVRVGVRVRVRVGGGVAVRVGGGVRVRVRVGVAHQLDELGAGEVLCLVEPLGGREP